MKHSPRHFMSAGIISLLALCSSCVLAKDTAQAKAFYEQASHRFEAEDFASAISLYSQAIKADPTYLSAWHDRGLAKLKQQDFKGAIADFEAILLRAKTDDEKSDAYAYRGEAHTGLKNFKTAESDLNQAIALCPQCGYYFLKRGQLYLQMQQPDKAKADFQQAWDRNIEEAEPLLQGL